MTRRPSRFIRLYANTVEKPRRELPAKAYLGPAAATDNSATVAHALGQIAVQFSGAAYLGLVQLPNGSWLCATTC
jgi:hypothetical protein